MNEYLKSVFAVFIGGFAGSLARLTVGLSTEYLVGDGWPLGTVLVNTSGSFILGFLTAQGMTRFPAWSRLGMTTGFLGSFTTLSAISLDVAVPLAQHGAAGLLIMGPYAVGSAVIGVVAAIAGLRLGAPSSAEKVSS